MKDSEQKQIEANEIIAAFERAGLVWDAKVVTFYPAGFDEMTAEEKQAANQRAIDEFEKYWEGLRQAGEHEIADTYFKRPDALSAVLGYLPK